jgi:hypothetical protein
MCQSSLYDTAEGRTRVDSKGKARKEGRRNARLLQSSLTRREDLFAVGDDDIVSVVDWSGGASEIGWLRRTLSHASDGG